MRRTAFCAVFAPRRGSGVSGAVICPTSPLFFIWFVGGGRPVSAPLAEGFTPGSSCYWEQSLRHSGTPREAVATWVGNSTWFARPKGSGVKKLEATARSPLILQAICGYLRLSAHSTYKQPFKAFSYGSSAVQELETLEEIGPDS